MRIVDVLAARQMLYYRPLATMPDVLLIDIPVAYASTSLPLGRYYPVILETEAEHREMEAFLNADHPRLIVPDIFDHRPSALLGDDIVFARYAPPCPGWPWLLLSRWPEEYAALVPRHDDHFARGAYTSECFGTIEELIEAEQRLFATLGSDRVVHLTCASEVMGQA